MYFVLTVLVLFAACAPATQSASVSPTSGPSVPEFDIMDGPAPIPPPLASPIVVSLDSPVAAAMDRTVAAFTAEGLRVERADREAMRVKSAGVLTDAVSAEDPGPATVQAEYFFHAMVEPAGRGSRVVLSVSLRSHRRTSDGIETTPEAEMQECQRMDTPDSEATFQRCEQQMARVQARLDNLARRVHAMPR